jgi:hypothetical protein
MEVSIKLSQSQPEISAVKAISSMEMEDAEVMDIMDFHAKVDKQYRN